MATPKKLKAARLVGEINYESIKEPLRDLDEANNDDQYESLRLTITSWGGDLYCAFALYDQIKASRKPVDVVAAGVCMSAAVMVMQAARRRVSRPHTVFMVHPSSGSVEGKPYPEFFAIADQYKKNHDLFVQLTTERAGIERAAFEQVYLPRKYLTPEEARSIGRYGLIDVIAASDATPGSGGAA